MNITAESADSSLAQRIAKVRNCMLVEVSTGVSPTDKDLFASLCQAYEQNSVKTSYTASTSSQDPLDQAFSISHLTPESILPHRFAATYERDTPPRQHRVGFSIIQWPNLAGGEDDFDQWDDWNDK